MEFCSPNRASGPPTLTHLITHVWTLPNTPTHTLCSLPRPGAPNTIPGPEDPVIKGCGHCPDRRWGPGQGHCSLSGFKVALRLLLSQETGRAWAAQGPKGRQRSSRETPDSPDDPPRLYYPIPAILKHSHQTGYRCQSFLTRPLQPAGFQGSPQLP